MTRPTAMLRLGAPLALVALHPGPDAPTALAHVAVVVQDTGTVFRVESSSAEAVTMWLTTDSSGSQTGGLVLLKRGATEADSAFLSYFLFQGDCESGTCVTLASGFGTIPGRDVTGSEHGSLRVDTHVTERPGFVLSGPAGVVNVTWSQTQAFTLFEEGTSSMTAGPAALRRHGTSERSSADAEGSVVGFPVPPAGLEASMGVSRGATIEVQRR